MSETFLDGRVTLYAGDCMVAIKDIADDSIDSFVSDPPYALVSIGKRFGADDAAPCKPGKTGAYQRASAGFMGKKWDNGETAFAVEFWREVYRVLKPGAHVVAFGGTRSYHRLACAIEDSGFEIRDQVRFDHDGNVEIAAFLDSLNDEQRRQFVKLFGEGETGQLGWSYGSGFPKSHNVGLGVEKALRWFDEDELATGQCSHTAAILAERGTALKPAWEPICLARKPLSEGTVAANVLRWGTGALNIEGCRVEGAKPDTTRGAGGQNGRFGPIAAQGRILDDGRGRWPANILHDGSAEVLAAFPDSDGQQRETGPQFETRREVFGKFDHVAAHQPRGDSGSAARFFYSAKADSDDRLGSKHPTVKPVDLMQWLCRLVTPPGGLVLDPFAGTGTTGAAAWREGFSAVLIEREAEYQADIARRMALCLAGPETRRIESAKARGRAVDAGPLFGGLEHPRGGADRSAESSPTRTADGAHDRTDQAQILRAAE